MPWQLPVAQARRPPTGAKLNPEHPLNKGLVACWVFGPSPACLRDYVYGKALAITTGASCASNGLHFDGTIGAKATCAYDAKLMANANTYTVVAAGQFASGDTDQRVFIGSLNGEDGSTYNSLSAKLLGASRDVSSKVRIGADATTRNSTFTSAGNLKWEFNFPISFGYCYDGANELNIANGIIVGSYAKAGTIWTNTEYSLQINVAYFSESDAHGVGTFFRASIWNRPLSSGEFWLEHRHPYGTADNPRFI